MVRRRAWLALTACVVLANAAAAQPRDLPRLAIADFEVAHSGTTLPPPQLGATMAQLMLHRLVDATQFHVYDPQFLRTASTASRSREAEQALRADAREAGDRLPGPRLGHPVLDGAEAARVWRRRPDSWAADRRHRRAPDQQPVPVDHGSGRRCADGRGGDDGDRDRRRPALARECRGPGGGAARRRRLFARIVECARRAAGRSHASGGRRGIGGPGQRRAAADRSRR